MRTTVVIATRNGSTRLLRTLRRLEALADRPPIIVVDNGSDDGTPQFVAAAHPHVRMIRLNVNLGACARTLGVAKARTPYVAFADDDSWWGDGALARAEAVLDAHPTIGLVAARIVVGDGEDPVSRTMRHSPLRDRAMPGPIILGFVACGAIVRREAFLEVGGFHRVLHFFGEETVLAQDLAAAGWTSVYLDAVIAEHEPDDAVDRRGRVALGMRNALLSVWMRRPVHIALARSVSLVHASVRQADARLALREALRRLPAALRARRRLPTDVEAAVRLVESGQMRPDLQIVPAVGADLRAAQDALEEEAGLLEGTLLRDIRDVG